MRVLGSELPLLVPQVYDPKLSSEIVPELNHATLFDRNGTGLIDNLKSMMELQRHYHPENCKYHQTMIDTIQANPACFTITRKEYQGNGTGILNLHFFESVYVVEYKPGQSRWEEINYIPDIRLLLKCCMQSNISKLIWKIVATLCVSRQA